MSKKARKKAKKAAAAARSPYVGARLQRDHVGAQRPELSRRYTAARSAPWRLIPIGADQSQDFAAREAWPHLLQWARHLDQNNPVCVAILDEMVTQIVGSGIEVIPMPRTANGRPIPQLVDPLVELYEEWSQAVDVTGELIRSEYERIECRGWLRDGERFEQHVTGRAPGTGYPFRSDQIPYVVEALESEMVPMERHDPAKGWHYGVRMNQWRQPKGYAVYKFPPDDYGHGSRAVTETDAKEIPADRVSHLKHVRRWPAVRGVTIFHAVIQTIHDLNEYEESERIAARIAASMSAFIKKDIALADQHAQAPPILDENGQPVATPPRELQFTPGMVFDDLLPGEEVGSIGVDRPNTALVSFRRELIRSAVGGVGCRYSPVARDFSGTYSSQRQELVEARPTYDRLRNYYIAKGPRERRERMILAAALDGRIQIPRGATAKSIANAVYLAPAIPWIDKLSEVQADKLEIEIGLTSLQEAQARRGYAVTDPEEARGDPVAPVTEVDAA